MASRGTVTVIRQSGGTLFHTSSSSFGSFSSSAFSRCCRSTLTPSRFYTSATTVTIRTPSSLFSKSRAAFGVRFMSSGDEKKDHVVMLILGKPGGGKGTVSGKILKDFPVFEHVSTGDVLRQHVRNETPLGTEVSKYISHGELVPDEVMIRLLLEEAEDLQAQHEAKLATEESSSSSGKVSLLLDGFPRTLEQAKALDGFMKVDLVVNLEIPTETIVARIADRWIHPASGRTYSYSYKPPKTKGLDDVTSEPLVQREDDKPEKVRARLQTYDNVTAPLVEYYEEKEVLKTFRGTMSDVIYVDVKQWLEEQLNGLDDK